MNRKRTKGPANLRADLCARDFTRNGDFIQRRQVQETDAISRTRDLQLRLRGTAPILESSKTRGGAAGACQAIIRRRGSNPASATKRDEFLRVYVIRIQKVISTLIQRKRILARQQHNIGLPRARRAGHLITKRAFAAYPLPRGKTCRARADRQVIRRSVGAEKIQRSSVVERSVVNRLVGSNPPLEPKCKLFTEEFLQRQDRSETNASGIASKSSAMKQFSNSATPATTPNE